MSAKLRSLIDYLKAPLRLWQRGRRLPARMQVTVLLAGLLSVALAFAVWKVARATPQEEGGGDPTQVDPQGRAVYEQVHQLRTTGQPGAARALALDYLNAHPEPTAARQLVHYEYAATFYAEERKDEALAAFEQVATGYGSLGLDPASPDCKVDNAQFFVGVLNTMLGHLSEAYAAYMIVYDTMPTADCAVDALRRANGVLRDQEKASMQEGVPTVDRGVLIEANVQRLVTEHPGDPATVEALSDLIGYLRDRSAWDATTRASLNDKVVAIVAQMRSLAPDSPLLARPSLAAADAFQATDPQQALVLVEDALRLAAADADLRLDAQSLKAHLLETVGRTQEAYDAYLTVYAQAEGPRAVAALRSANLVLIGHERASEGTGAAVDNAAVIEANAQRLLAEHPGAVENLEVLLDLVNFHADRPRWNPGAKAASQAKVNETVALMKQLAPDAALTVRGQLRMAEMLQPDEPERALLLIDEVIQRATALDDESLRLDALFTKGRMLEDARRPDQAHSLYLSIYTNNPTSERAVAALRLANLVLMGQERASDGTAAVVDNAAAVEANAQRLLADHPGAVENLEVLLDLVNFHADRPRWNPASREMSKAKVVETVGQMESLAPDAALTVRGLLQMAEVVRPEEPDRALTLIDDVIRRAAALNDGGLQVDAEMTKGSFLEKAERARDAHDVYLAVYQRDPHGERAAAALRAANLALMGAEHAAWRPRDGVRMVPSTIDYAADIEANLARFLQDRPQDPAAGDLLSDLMHRSWDRMTWNPAPTIRAQAKHRLQEAAAQVQALVPGSELAARAALVSIEAIGFDDPQGALPQLDELIQRLSTQGPERVALDARLVKAHLLDMAGRPAEARAIWEAELARDFAPLPEDIIKQTVDAEVRMQIGGTYAKEGQYAKALDAFAPVVDSDRFTDDLRAAAMMGMWKVQREAGRTDEAQATLDALLARYPQTTAANAARYRLARPERTR